MISWIYDIPSWLFGALTIGITVAVGLTGLYVTRRWVQHVHGARHSHNEVVGYYLAAVCVFYGITLGLLAVASWQTYSDVATRVGEEAAARGFNQIAEFRGRRLQSVNGGLAHPLWIVVFAGAVLNIGVTWFFDLRSQTMHFWMTVFLSALLGLLIYLLAALDNPFRGAIGISPEPFEIMYTRRMQDGK